MFENQLIKQRMLKAKELKEGGQNPFPHFIHKELSITEFKEKFAYINNLDDKRDSSKTASTAGRIKLLRIAGKSIFANIEDSDSNIQIYLSENTLGKEEFNKCKKYYEVGDIVLVNGFAFLTKTGEFSLNVQKITLASKAITPLPEKFHGLTDKELRYRKRYLDMIMDPKIRHDFALKAKILMLLRTFFTQKGFLECETPILHPIAGGANAKPFITHHNALGVKRYLRIAPELYLKRLIVGGFEAIFEINRCFRNEGMDLTHNPEFTTIEYYWAYHDYKDLMDLNEELFAFLFKSLDLPSKIIWGEAEVDFSKGFERISYKDSLIKYGGLGEEIIKDKEKLLLKLKEDGFSVNEKLSLGYIQAEAFDNYVEAKLINPTFITDYPVAISPLSRRSDLDPEIAERFELFIAGKEIANGFNELNDPNDQYERFLKQIEAKEAGDDEACDMDEDFVEALSYGMAPTAGCGIGVDRLIMLLMNKKSIRDVILFPAMKPKN